MGAGVFGRSLSFFGLHGERRGEGRFGSIAWRPLVFNTAQQWLRTLSLLFEHRRRSRYAGSQSGSMYALDAATGKILWSFASGGTVLDGPSIADGVVYWGSGYNNPGTPNNKLYAFSIEHHKN